MPSDPTGRRPGYRTAPYWEKVGGVVCCADPDEFQDLMESLWEMGGARSSADVIAQWCHILHAYAPAQARDITGMVRITDRVRAPEVFAEYNLRSAVTGAAQRRSDLPPHEAISLYLEEGDRQYAIISELCTIVQDAVSRARECEPDVTAAHIWREFCKRDWQGHGNIHVTAVLWSQAIYATVMDDGPPMLVRHMKKQREGDNAGHD